MKNIILIVLSTSCVAAPVIVALKLQQYTHMELRAGSSETDQVEQAVKRHNQQINRNRQKLSELEAKLNVLITEQKQTNSVYLPIINSPTIVSPVH